MTAKSVPEATRIGDHWTAEQRLTFENRRGELLLDAGAGSGKTAVLVERFVRTVLEDGVEVGRILTITFTDKAAGEMRERIRHRLGELGAHDAARATETAFISTIHGFCGRLLRAHALTAGLDPRFTVLDEVQAGRLAELAFRAAIEEVAATPGGVALLAAHGMDELRGATRGIYGELRARGQRRPRLPTVPRSDEIAPAAAALAVTAARLREELTAIPDPSPRLVDAIERLSRVPTVELGTVGWPGDLDELRLPSGNGAALQTSAARAYAAALQALRSAWAGAWAREVLPELDRLLDAFAREYEKRKRAVSGVDFQDLELEAAALLRANPGLRAAYRERFEQVMVDELQDTNAVQLALIDAVSAKNLFAVGDAQQAIYGFRHADVELFERRGAELHARGCRATLQTNFRSHPGIVAVINRVFAHALGPRFRALIPGARGEAGDRPRVELLLADREAEWAHAPDGLGAPWRLAEAQILAGRIAELVSQGTGPGSIVVLTRAATDLRAYERALETRAVPTYLIGGRGYWAHPQVIDIVAYLRLLANPRDEEALYTALVSPLLGVSYDALVLLGAATRAAGRDPWWVLRHPPEGALDSLPEAERERILAFGAWVADERAAAARIGVEELIDRALERTGYDLAVLAMPGGPRRLANVRKLMRLGREHLASEGPNLRSFLELVRDRARGAGFGGGGREGEAPVESEALDAVRLMTIHRAKGLEFDVVCVADLGRGPRAASELLRVGADGRVGLRLARPGTGPHEKALDYEELGEERQRRESEEERRLFYVAATRARRRLMFSGAARLEKWGETGVGPPIVWLGPALVPRLPELLEQGETVWDGVRFSVVGVDDLPSPVATEAVKAGGGPKTPGPGDLCSPEPPPPAPAPTGGATALSYSAISDYHRCAYRYYVQRELRLPDAETPGGPASAGLTAAERGTLVHSVLERLNFRRPVIPAAVEEDIADLVRGFTTSELCRRLAKARWVRREQPFGFLLDGTLITGVLDVLAREETSRALIVDYKTDRLDGVEPAVAAASRYGMQQLIYALAALRDGAQEVEVAHVFLESPETPVTASFPADASPKLERELTRLVAGLQRREFPVTQAPHRGICQGCPAAAGLCSWPLEAIRREAPDRLF